MSRVITVTTAFPRPSSSAAFTLGCLPSRIRLHVVGNGSFNRPLSPPASGAVRPPEISLYKLSDAVAAHRLSESRHFRGKLVFLVR